jgi:hypothetical protein
MLRRNRPVSEILRFFLLSLPPQPAKKRSTSLRKTFINATVN